MGNRQRKLFKSCRSKIKYASREAANLATQEGRLALDRLAAYSCRYCGGWHIGHQTNEPQSAAEAGKVGVVATNTSQPRTPGTMARRAELREHKLLMRSYRAQERDDDGG